MKHNLINFVLFQVIWFVFIFSAADESSSLLIMGVTLLLLQFLKNKQFKADGLLILIAIIIGIIHDSSLSYFNFIIYMYDFNINYSPIWIIGLWVSFALTINHSLTWLKENKVLQVIFGLIGGPLAYFAGEKLGAIQLVNEHAIYILAISWAIATPVLFKFQKKGQ